MTKTIAEARDGIAAKAAERIQALQVQADWLQRIYSELPNDVPCPTVSNESEKAHDGRAGAWLSWRRSYGDEWIGSDILAKLEAAGFKPLPATLARYGQYRRSPHVGYQHELPEIYSRSPLVDSEPIAPVWIEPNQYTDPEALAYYQAPSGLVYRVSVPAPRVVYLTGRRVNYLGDWHFERGSARVHVPDAWQSITTADDETPITQVSVHTAGYVDTEKGISGRIYFTPLMDHPDFPLTPSAFLQRLELTATAKTSS